MSNKMYVQWNQINEALALMVADIVRNIKLEMLSESHMLKVYGWPRGGSVIAGMMNGRPVTIEEQKVTFIAVDTLEECDIVVDDIYDTGNTARKISKALEGTGKKWCSLFVLFDKKKPEYAEQWIVFPWEESAETDIEEHVVRILEYLGEDPTRDGLKDTPKRVVKSWKEIYGGYNSDPAEILSTAFDNDGSYNEMVVLSNITFHSMCEHHMLPFVGEAHIAYIPKPNGKVVGISKLARLVEAFAQRLQIQEKMTKDIARELEEQLNAEGVAVVIKAQHLCMKMRGVKNASSWMTTSSLSGEFKRAEVRAEFMSLIH